MTYIPNKAKTGLITGARNVFRTQSMFSKSAQKDERLVTGCKLSQPFQAVSRLAGYRINEEHYGCQRKE